MNGDQNLQNYLFDTVLGKYPKKSDAISALSDLLGVGSDAVYRRVRGDSDLTPKEIGLIANKFKISVDSHIFNETDHISFQFNPFVKIIKTFDDYLDDIHGDVRALGSIPDVMIYYASSEIPIFYYIAEPELFSFKLYVWGRSIWNFDYLQKADFHFNLISPSVLEKAKEVWRLYRMQSSTEMWSLNIVDNTLNQIEYHFQTNSFKNRADAIHLCDRLVSLTRNLELMAQQGSKVDSSAKINNGGNNFTLYHNEIIYTNNTILVDSPHFKSVYSTFGNPNFLKSSDLRLFNYTQKWFNDVIAKSTQISLHGEKNRKWFFDRLYRRIETLKQRIELNLNDRF